MALTDLLSAIGNAIREMTGTTEKLTLAEMPNKIRTIDNLVNYVAGKPTKIESDEITSLRTNMFSQAENLTELKLPNLQSIDGSYAIYQTKVKTLDFPKLTKMQSDSINFNTALEYANFPNLETGAGYGEGFGFDYHSKLKQISIPKVRHISFQGFKDAQTLERLDLPSVIQITNVSYSNPFSGCKKLTVLILRANQLVQLTDSTNLFNECPINNGGYNGLQGYIYVPKALLEDYKVATNWSVYADRFRAIEDYPDICGEVAQ